MAEAPAAVIDANVVLDVLQEREPWYTDAAALVAAAEDGRLRGMLAAHTVTTIYYLTAKRASRDIARMQVAELLRFLGIAAVDRSVIAHALSLPYDDVEDAVQMAAAEAAGADYVVTRDSRSFRTGPLPALTPAEMLALLNDHADAEVGA